MYRVPAFTLTLALLSLLVGWENLLAQRGGRGAGGSRGGNAPAAENDEQEMSGRGRGGRRGAAAGRAGGFPESSAGKLFSAIDSNDDGVITREEMEDAMRAFAKLDEDKDGRLTAEEAGERATGGRGAAMRGRGGQGRSLGDAQGGARRGGGGQRGGSGQRGREEAALGAPATGGKSGQGNPLLDD